MPISIDARGVDSADEIGAGSPPTDTGHPVSDQSGERSGNGRSPGTKTWDLALVVVMRIRSGLLALLLLLLAPGGKGLTPGVGVRVGTTCYIFQFIIGELLSIVVVVFLLVIHVGSRL